MSIAFLDESGEIIYKHGQFDSPKNKPCGKSRSRFAAKVDKAIINPIFIEMKKYTKDPFWIEKLTKWSIGKVCTKYRFCNGILTYSKQCAKQIPNCHKLDLNEILESTNPIIIQPAFTKLKVFVSKCSGDISSEDRSANKNKEVIFYKGVEMLKRSQSTVRKSMGKPDIAIDMVERYITEDGSDDAFLRDSLKLLISTKNISMINHDEDTQKIISIDGIKKLNNGYYKINIPKVKPLKQSTVYDPDRISKKATPLELDPKVTIEDDIFDNDNDSEDDESDGTLLLIKGGLSAFEKILMKCKKNLPK